MGNRKHQIVNRMENILELRTINELQKYSFYIPSYQRGFRWQQKQVDELLNDISEFRPREVGGKDEKTWYCLQPIVVRKKDGGQYEVIDGQQRLTTIYLILHFINSVYTEENRTKLFELDYQTRPGSSLFLKKLKRGIDNSENIDFYYISRAYKAICEWFDTPDFNRTEFESKFKFNAKVIWYESNEDDPIAVFTRLNIGKIPLTNAELIKALFLNRSNFDNSQPDKLRLKQLEISSEWDHIEHSLQDDRLWYFLNANKISTNRIEFIFDLMNNEKDETDNYSTFRFFNRKFKNKNLKTIEKNWKEIKKYHQRFTEWFEERDLYHKIGYLIAVDSITIDNLFKESSKLSKSEFRQLLDGMIKKNLKKVSLEELQYGDKDVKSVLLLYNILTMLNNPNDNSYFPFEKYKNEKWDIEHITSVTDSMPNDRQKWLQDAKTFIDNTIEGGIELKKRADDADCSIDDEFEELFKDIVEHFNSHIEDEDINDISNLALLDSETNRGYKNAVFPLKRKTIIDREKNGTFIPLCTKNVFLKYFNDYPPKISFWTQEDRNKYYQDLDEVLKPFLNEM